MPVLWQNRKGFPTKIDIHPFFFQELFLVFISRCSFSAEQIAEGPPPWFSIPFAF